MAWNFLPTENSYSSVLVGTLNVYGQNIFRLIDPHAETSFDRRYGKSPDDGPPFLYFGSTNQQYYIDHADYAGLESEVETAFISWNNSGPVQFTESSSSGVQVTGEFQPGAGPAWAWVWWNANTYELIPEISSIVLNTEFTWTDDDQHILNGILDVQSMVVHEAGHVHGLAHPLVESFEQDETAPVMAGGDNEYYWTSLEGRYLKEDDIVGLQFLQFRVPGLYSDLQAALNAAESYNATVNTWDSFTFNNNLEVPANVALKLNPGSSGDLNNCTIKHATRGIDVNDAVISVKNSEITDNSTGIRLNNLGLWYAEITDNLIDNNSSAAIEIYYSSRQKIEKNSIGGNDYGVFSVGSSPSIREGDFISNGNGIYLVNNSTLYDSELNRMMGNGTALYAESPVFVTFQNNDVYVVSGGVYAVRADHDVTVMASNSYWGQYPPNPNHFYATTLELENLILMRKKNYEQVIDNFRTLRKRFSFHPLFHKNSLFGLGYVYTVMMNSPDAGQDYFDELVSSYPGDALTESAVLIMSEVGRSPYDYAVDGSPSESADELTLLGNYPNPFNPVTVIQFSIPGDGMVKLSVYDILGRKVAVLVDEFKEAGVYSERFNAVHLPSGVYLTRLEAGGQSLVQRMLLVK